MAQPYTDYGVRRGTAVTALSERPQSEVSGAATKLHALTSLRFPLALGVVLYHFRMAWPDPGFDASGYVERARLNVDAFFILSGFILTHVYGQDFASGRYMHSRFVIARIARIFPLHWLLMAAIGVIAVAAAAAGAKFDQVRFRLADLPAMLLLVHTWLPTTADEMRWNGPAWSLSAEWFAYLLFPAYAWLGVKLRDRPLILIGIAVGSFVLLDLTYQALFAAPLTHAWLNLGIVRIAPEFLYGVGIYYLVQKLPPRSGWAWPASFGAAAIFLLLMHASADDRLIVASAGLLILTLALLGRAGSEGLLAHPIAVAAGEASYALYLVHWPMIVAWKGVADRFAGAGGEQLTSFGGLLVLLVLVVLAAVVLHYAWERPAQRWVRTRLLRSQPTVAAGVQ